MGKKSDLFGLMDSLQGEHIPAEPVVRMNHCHHPADDCQCADCCDCADCSCDCGKW